MNSEERFHRAMARFDEENGRDPDQELDRGEGIPRELLFAKRLSEWVRRLCPEASEELRLAARCQHICRWMIPRSSYEMTRSGYLKWRNQLKQFHAQKSGEILREVGYPEETIRKVQALNLKSGFPTDPEAQALEDALCLVFLQHQFAGLAAKTQEEKVLNALRKTWKKMSPMARDLAMQIAYEPRERALLLRALDREA